MQKTKKKKKETMNAYLLFAKEVKMAVLKETPSATQDEIDAIVQRKWRFILTSEEKRPYFDRAEKLRRDNANKQQRKRERARAASAAAALTVVKDPTTLTAEATEIEDEPPSAPASPDSGCPSTPEGSDTASISPSDSFRRLCNGKTYSATGHEHPVKLMPTEAAMMGTNPGIATGPNGYQQYAYPPMVPQMIHPAFPLPYMQPYFYPTATMMHPQMHAYYAAHMSYPTPVQPNMPFYGNHYGGQMVNPQPYYAIYPAAAPQPPMTQIPGCCHVASSTPISTSRTEMAGGDAAVGAHGNPQRDAAVGCHSRPQQDATACLASLAGLSIHDDDAKSDYSLNDVSFDPARTGSA